MAEYRIPVAVQEQVAEGTLGVWFDIRDVDLEYREGQHADFALLDAPESDDRESERTFSFASADGGRDRFLIATRLRGSSFKERLAELSPGKEVRVSGPAGALTLHEDESRAAIFLAGGIGITPVRAILERATRDGSSRPLRLFYSNRTPESTPFLDELRDWRDRNPGLEMVATMTRLEECDSAWSGPVGRIDEEMLRAHLDDDALEEGIFYLTGPGGFLEGMQELLSQMDVDGLRIKSERFYGYDD